MTQPAVGPGAQLDEQYDSYVKRYADVGIDIAVTPFEIAPAPHTSLGGVAVDENCGTGVEGLYACGEVTGGLHGANRLGGNAGLETMVFGRDCRKKRGGLFGDGQSAGYRRCGYGGFCLRHAFTFRSYPGNGGTACVMPRAAFADFNG